MNKQRLIEINHGNYISLPKDLILNPGTLWEDFEVDADWIDSAWGIGTANAVEFKSGTKSEKATVAATHAGSIHKLGAWDLSNDWKQLRYWMYFHNVTYTDMPNMYLEFHTAYLSDYYQAKINVGPATAPYFKLGWNYVTWPKNEFLVKAGVPDWASIVRFRLAHDAPAAVDLVVSYDNAVFGYNCVPAVMYSFDDGFNSQYAGAFQYMRPRNMRGTLFMQTNQIGIGLTAAQLIEMQTAGWTIANHTQSHPNLDTLTEAQQETELAAGKADLDAIGITGGHYVAYPAGRWNENTRTAMTALGYRLGVSTHPTTLYSAGQYPALTLPLSDAMNVGRTMVDTAHYNLAQAKTIIDRTIANGTIASLYFHALDAGGLTWTSADFQALVDYRRTEIAYITIDDLYKLTFTALRVPKVF